MYISFSLKTYPYFSLSLLLHFSPFSYLPHLVSTAFSIKFSLLPCDRAGLLNYEALHARAKRFKGFPQPHVQLQGYLATTQRERERRGEAAWGTNWQLKSLLMGFMFTTSIERKPLFAFGPKMTPSSSSSSSSNYTAKRKVKKDRRRGRRAEGGSRRGQRNYLNYCANFSVGNCQRGKDEGERGQ